MSNVTNNLTRYGLCVALLATSSLAAAAGQDLAERVAACAREHDDTARLACFDRLTARPAATTTGTPAPQAPAAAKSAPAPVAPAATAAAAGATAGAATSSVDEFGVKGSEVARQRDTESQKQGGQDKVDRINASVTALATRGRGEIVVTLDNGQVWAQKDAQYIPIKVGDKVTILAGALHSYRLIAAGRATPVTRIQ